MELLTGALSVLTTTLALIMPFSKKMSTVLIFNLVINGLVGVNYLLTESYSGLLICVAAIVCLVINYFFTSRGRDIPVYIVVLEGVLFLGANLAVFAYWYDILAIIASLLFVLLIAQKTTKYYRVVHIANSLVWLPYDFLSGSYANLFTHSVLTIAIFVSMIINDRKKGTA